MYYIQNRWKLEGRKLQYYGLRNAPNMFRNSIALSKKQADLLAALPKAHPSHLRKPKSSLRNTAELSSLPPLTAGSASSRNKGAGG